MRELPRLLGAVAVGVAIFVGALVVGRLVGFDIPGPALAVAAILLTVGVWFVYDSIERVDPPDWPAPAIPRALPALPSEVRARRLQAMAQGALENRSISAQDMGAELADLVGDRLVARHGADPQDPLAEAPAHLTRDFAAYLQQSLDGRPPRLRRAVLHAYLKEIDAL